ncbi:hypothetical protein B0H17DRAFT_1215659 [Mycena rosella]|uniref:LCCL domain-containing protein n=1 Tax=Mycena rosella TaxID=1033263 RepID=A0AAD7CH02_MYCRO|nr:hypothetical protein B0H17DRAFT_1215659 [Mycena rosella]
MAVPATYTTLDLSGKCTMNKTLTDQSALDAVLKLQGVGMLKRKAVGLAAPTMRIRHFTNAAGVEQLEIEQVGVLRLGESAAVDVDREDQRVAAPWYRRGAHERGELGDAFLESGWTAETLEHGLIEAEMRGGDAKWTFVQTWAVEEVNNGERRHVRHARCTGPKGKVIEMKFVYDYAGSL